MKNASNGGLFKELSVQDLDQSGNPASTLNQSRMVQPGWARDTSAPVDRSVVRDPPNAGNGTGASAREDAGKPSRRIRPQIFPGSEYGQPYRNELCDEWATKGEIVRPILFSEMVDEKERCAVKYKPANPFQADTLFQGSVFGFPNESQLRAAPSVAAPRRRSFWEKPKFSP